MGKEINSCYYYVVLKEKKGKGVTWRFALLTWHLEVRRLWFLTTKLKSIVC